MREHRITGSALFSVAIAAMFVIAALAIISNDSGKAASADEDAYLGTGTTYEIGVGETYETIESLLGSVTLASGDTIKLLTDVTCYETLVVVTDLTID